MSVLILRGNSSSGYSDPYAFRALTGSDLYFDPTAGSDGSGSAASPYNVMNITRWRSLSAGQALVLMNSGGSGNYTPINLSSMPDGSAGNPITVVRYPGHPLLNFNFPGSGCSLVDVAYWDFRGINFVVSRDGWLMGNAASSLGQAVPEGPSTNIRFIDCTGSKTSNAFTDNSGILCAANSAGSADFLSFIRCNLTGTAGGTQNQSGIWLDYVHTSEIIGCLIDQFANPIYYKHTDQTSDATQNALIKNCILRRAGRGVRASINWLTILNTAFDAAPLGMDESGGGSTGGNDGTISHCTFLNTDWFMAADDSTVRQRTTALNCVMVGTSRWKDNPFSSTDGGNLINYTATDTGSHYYRDHSVRTMAVYKSTYPSQEVNGVTGTIALVGGASPGVTAANWALAGGSVGIGNASDGGNRGVDATKLLTVS